MIFRWIILGLLITWVNAASAETIVDLYQSAKTNYPKNKRLDLELEIQNARVQELKAAFYPELSFEGVYFYGNQTLKSRSGIDRVDGQNAFSLKATLYNGGAEYSYFRFKEILPALAKNNKNSELFSFFLQINALYFDYLSLDNQQKLMAKQMESLKKRAAVLKNWGQIGKSRKSDYLSTLAQLKSLEGQRQLVLEKRETQGINLRTLVGREIDPNSAELKFDDYIQLPKSWGREVAERPEYQLLKSSLLEQRESILIESSALMPKVNLQSNYYLNRRQFGRQDDWDVALTLSWSFYDFGATNARESQERLKSYQLERDLETAQLNLTKEAKVVEVQFYSQLKRKEILKESLDVSRQNYEEQAKEFQNGLVDTLDLNRAMEQMIEAEIAYETVKYTLAEQWFAMKLICGEIIL